MTARAQARDPWVRRFARSVRDAWAWARSRHLPALLSVVALVLLLIAERNLLKEVLHAQEGLRDALGELKLTVNDELGAARKALEDTQVLENDIRGRLDIVHGKELNDVPVLARALKDALDAGVGRARDVASALGAGGDSATRPGGQASMQAELASLTADLSEIHRRISELGQRANEAELALGGGTDGGVRGFPNVQAQASRIAQRLSEAEAVMFARDTAGGADAGLVSSARVSQTGRPSEPFPRCTRGQRKSPLDSTGALPGSSAREGRRSSLTSSGSCATSRPGFSRSRPGSTEWTRGCGCRRRYPTGEPLPPTRALRRCPPPRSEPLTDGSPAFDAPGAGQAVDRAALATRTS